MTSEARWRDLYTGLEELLGTDRADTLMSRLSLHPIDELATRADVLATKADVDRQFADVYERFEQVDRRFEQVDRRFEQVDRRFDKVDGEIARLHDRIDRLQLTLAAGLFGIIAAIILQTIFS